MWMVKIREKKMKYRLPKDIDQKKKEDGSKTKKTYRRCPFTHSTYKNMVQAFQRWFHLDIHITKLICTS